MNGFRFKITWPAWYWLSAAAFLAFVLLTWQVLALGPQAFDEDIAHDCKAHADSHIGIRNFFWAVTQLGSRVALGILAGAAAGLLLLKRKRFLAAVWVFAVIAGSLLNYGMKGQVGRLRPDLDLRDPGVHETSQSYPSGHAMGSTVGLGLCVYLVLRGVQRRPVRILAASGLISLIALIGFSRIYLRAHWCSDVLGGYAIGAAWLIFCVGVYERRRATLPPPEDELIQG
jgi:membrane-associated phospholipid phosphatase